jgi:DNA helicase-2/ATP-dependent DNA helicase PcrA
MVTFELLLNAYESFRPPPNDEQRWAIEQAPDEAVFIVAGPGTGKTTCLALRILKLILVDGIAPRSVLATTFTVKAAEELRSRILSWGFRLVDELLKDDSLTPADVQRLKKLDINQVVTGTIDSICERILRDFREAGTQPPVLVDEYVGKTLMLREGLLKNRRYEDADLDDYLLPINGGTKFGYNANKKNDILLDIWDRRFQDQLDWREFIRRAPRAERAARSILDDILEDYESALRSRGMLDFALLEQEVLRRLQNEQLGEFLSQTRVILVDEYQDTNLLQEAIYFRMARACGGALTVVGDDDQSLYRFRGATVELFSDFENRCRAHLGKMPRKVFLTKNYRSTRNVIDFVNDYAELDAAYQSARVRSKPRLEENPDAADGIPILGMFRADVQTLGRDLAEFIRKIFRGKGYRLPTGELIQAAEDGGDLGDCALLCSSPQDYDFGKKNDRLPLVLRNELLRHGIGVFNPRGQDLTEIPVIEIFGGLLLECLDPFATIQNDLEQNGKILMSTGIVFRRWRDRAIAFVNSDEAPDGLLSYSAAWTKRHEPNPRYRWERSVPVLELVYALVHFFPEFHDDPEGQVYLEVFTRQISACEQVGKFSARIITDAAEPGLSGKSIVELMRDFLGPIAAGTIKVNEDLMETFPRTLLSILSVHQSKGLEFPLTIVDVGSDFRTRHPKNAFKRFPSDGGAPHITEDIFRPHSPLGAPSRSQRDRAFDDLYRQFFVAFSRPQEVLLLVGLDGVCPAGTIESVATGWDRTGNCHWDQNTPLLLI